MNEHVRAAGLGARRGGARTASVRDATPDAVRGRVCGIELARVAGAPSLDDVEAGAFAAVTSPRCWVASGGVLCAVGTLATAAAIPGLLRDDAKARRA